MCRRPTEEEVKATDKEIESFFAKNNKTLAPQIDIIKTCKEFGFKVLSLSLPKGVDGVIIADKDDKIIGVSNTVPPQDARFVIAHELAHYIHDLRGKSEEEALVAMKDSVLHGKEKNDLEHLMDLFAASILVPKDDFLVDMKSFAIKKTRDVKEAARVSFNIVRELAEKYDVNEDLIIRRIAEVSCYA
ncbi:MAG: ImmA/IrrE family metallo-endopeptidase [Clostridia bacterium]|nr:ImmA/IrrE family metallo-endopeptidase [Clostridia bacterium]